MIGAYVPYGQRSVGWVLDGNGCWLWTGAISPNGYGRVGVLGQPRVAQAHRMIYEEMVGPVARGMDLDHLCRVRHCVNPDHLEVVDRRTNARRGAGTHLEADDVREIRRLRAEGWKMIPLAKRFGITHGYASRLIRGKDGLWVGV